MDETKTFVFIPGAWMGDWIWEGTMDQLNAQGHRAYSLTLSGLKPGDDAGDVSLQTHVEDVIGLIENNELDNVNVVGHSYSGIVAGMMADRLPERVRHTIFVNAVVPKYGKTLLDSFGEGQEKERQEIAKNDGLWLPPDMASLANEFDFSVEQQRWLNERFVAHPGRTVTEPATINRPLADLSASFIACLEKGELSEETEAMCREYGWDFYALEAGHWPMVSVPDELIALIEKAGR